MLFVGDAVQIKSDQQIIGPSVIFTAPTVGKV